MIWNFTHDEWRLWYYQTWLCSMKLQQYMQTFWVILGEIHPSWNITSIYCTYLDFTLRNHHFEQVQRQLSKAKKSADYVFTMQLHNQKYLKGEGSSKHQSSFFMHAREGNLGLHRKTMSEIEPLQAKIHNGSHCSKALSKLRTNHVNMLKCLRGWVQLSAIF